MTEISVYVILERHNHSNATRGEWRRGWFRKWFTTKRGAEVALKESSKETGDTFGIEYRIFESKIKAI